MAHGNFERRRSKKIAVATIVVGIVISAIVAVALFYLSRIHPGF